MSISDYAAVKNNFPLLKDLTQSQFDAFNKMKAKDKKMLTIDWSRPETIAVAAGTTKIQEFNLLTPPPSWYAVSNDYDTNLKKISKWWGIQSATNQRAAIKEHDDLKYCQKREYMENILVMMEKQHFMHCTLIGERPNLICPPIDSQEAAPCPESIQGRPRTISNDSSDNSGNPRPTRRSRNRSRSTSQENSTMSLSSVTMSERDDTNMSMVDNLDDASEVEEDELGISHEQGIFHDEGLPGTENSTRVGTRKKKTSVPKHLASSKVLDSQKALLSKLVQFVKMTPSGNDIRKDANDILVVNIRTIKLTGSSQTAGCSTVPLDDGKTIVSVFSRSRLHFLRIMEALVKATLGHESDVNTNRAEYGRMFECKYIVGDDGLSLEDAINNYHDELKQTR